jgi:LPS sulfotransferase NodH
VTKPVRYLITCPARSGSTLLTWCLRAHPQICAHGELFGRDDPLNLYGLAGGHSGPLELALRRMRDRDPVRFLHDVAFEAGDRRAVGVKFKYEELLLRHWAALRRSIGRDRSIRILHLQRENLLERYLSQRVATEVTHVYNVTSEGARPDETAVALSPRDCLADFALTQERATTVRQLFAGHPVLELTYERLDADRDATLAEVQAFLGVDVVALEPRSVKLRTRPLRDAISNYDELKAALAATPYAGFIS